MILVSCSKIFAFGNKMEFWKLFFMAHAYYLTKNHYLRNMKVEFDWNVSSVIFLILFGTLAVVGSTSVMALLVAGVSLYTGMLKKSSNNLFIIAR